MINIGKVIFTAQELGGLLKYNMKDSGYLKNPLTFVLIAIFSRTSI